MVSELTVLVHADTQALLEATGLALVAPSGVDDAPVVGLADVLHVTTHGALKEATAAVAARHSVVLARSTVAAYQTASACCRPQSACCCCCWQWLTSKLYGG